ncbi:hypothetical protein [Streptomyces sp. MJP52]|uniref:DUF7919 family protein n=1 Tax=Streptomyces sp. MJP52 TaxID=2940555 RepID=UPI0024771664|nr:hypothetical protein [Streptomyces sp. MJP52]MDH6225500.1 hypothetical protein [Streptomyces sp. MJP52]
MTYYADLTPYTFLPPDGPGAGAPRPWHGLPLLNVGWLSAARRYRRGTPPPGLAETLRRMTRTHRAGQTRGFHLCPWCSMRLLRAGPECPRGSAEIRAVGDGVAYAAPELIAHYVESHGYLPPDGFVHAVLRDREG